VAVDIRQGSPTYGQHVVAELTAENGHQLYIPVGFAHAFLTLEPDCEITYKCSALYAPAHDGGIRWNSAGIDWPIPVGTTPELSDKDKQLPTLADFDSPFLYDGSPLGPIA
jgi:dTDP-4-dehydrorhamnose 3,5-epimerase